MEHMTDRIVITRELLEEAIEGGMLDRREVKQWDPPTVWDTEVAMHVWHWKTYGCDFGDTKEMRVKRLTERGFFFGGTHSRVDPATTRDAKIEEDRELIKRFIAAAREGGAASEDYLNILHYEMYRAACRLA